MSFPEHPNESARLAALKRLGILDTLPEQEYDDIVLLASRICQTPIALISLVDAERQWFKARLGLNVPETSRDVAFCAYTILGDKPFIVPDATKDERFATNPLVTGEPDIRCYAGVPLLTHEGHALGSLCVIDSKPRNLDADQIAALSALGRQLMVVLESRLQRAEIQLANEALHRSEKLFSTAFRANPLPISISRLSDGVFLDVNEAFLKLLGSTRDNIIGRSSVDLGLWGDAAERESLVELIQLKGGVRGLERNVRMPDGGMHYLLATAEIVNLNDEPCVLSMFLDISDRVHAEMASAQARDAAMESARLKSEFLANMSHEIRTPLNGVMGMTQLLLDSKLSDEQRDFAETAHSSAEALLVLINDILDFSKIEAGKLEVEIQNFELDEVVESAVELLAHQASRKSLELGVAIDPKVPLLLQGDAGRLRQILVNLVGNAVKFTEAGEVVTSVHLESREAGTAKLRFSVRDTGIGMSPEALKRIFHAFEQADGSTARKYGGSGLGLSICRRLVELMGGEIGVISEQGKGSTFWFTVSLPEQEGAQRAAARMDLSIDGAMILVVDDNESTRLTLEQQISSWRMKPRLVATAEEGLAALRESEQKGSVFDAVIIDQHLPGNCGEELARSMKDAAKSPPRVILLTKLGQKPSASDLQNSGIVACVTKPIRQSNLLEAIQIALGQTNLMKKRQASESSAHGAPEGQKSKLKVLLAEDNPVNAKLGILQLAKLGYDAAVAGNGIEVLEALELIPYDVILMDGQMPEMDGYEATRRIRESTSPGSLGNRPYIIALTAQAMKGDREACFEAGMNDYLSKPVRLPELSEAMARAEEALAADR